MVDKVWNELCILSINNIGLTDEVLKYLKNLPMPNLKRINIKGNNFTDIGIEMLENFGIKDFDISYKNVKKKERKIIKLKYFIIIIF